MARVWEVAHVDAGARVILTGIRPEIAQTLVGLGLDLSGIVTHGSLQSGIAHALAPAAAPRRPAERMRYGGSACHLQPQAARPPSSASARTGAPETCSACSPG